MRPFGKFIAPAALVLALGTGTAWAGNPATISVTVTIQNLSVSASGPIAFGTVVAATSTVSGGASTVTNDGNVTETFSLQLTNPATWTAVGAAPAAEQYALLAEFNNAAPAVGGFTYATHSLTTSSVASSATQFAGNQTGLSVAASGTRSLWFRFDAPTTTAVTTQQTITVTLTAAAG